MYISSKKQKKFNDQIIKYVDELVDCLEARINNIENCLSKLAKGEEIKLDRGRIGGPAWWAKTNDMQRVMDIGSKREAAGD